jgi:hypothetical protein
MSFEEGFATGLKLRAMLDARERERKAIEIYKKMNPDSGTPSASTVPQDYVKGTSFGGQQTMMPKGAIAMADQGVTTSPLRSEGQIMDTSAPTGFATDTQTDFNPTSPYGTNEQTGAQSPADMPYGFGAIPKDYQPMEGNVDTTPTQEVPTQENPMSPIPPVAGAEQPPAGDTKGTNLYQQMHAEVSSALSKKSAHEEELNRIKSTAHEMRKQGLFKEAEDYESKKLAAEKDVHDSTKSYYDVASKGLDLQASLASSFLNAVKGGMNPDVAWSQAIMKAHALGLPDMDKYAGLQGDDRMKMAQMIVDNATTTKDRFKSDMAALKEQNVNERFIKTQQRLKDNDSERERNSAFERDLKTKKYNLDELKADFGMANKKVENLRSDLKAKQERFDKLRKGDYITDEFGMVLEGPERNREALLVGQEIKSLQGALDVAETRVNSIKPNLPKGEAKTIEKENTINASVAKITPQVVDQVTKDINNNPTQIPAITKAFEELHPGLSLNVDNSAGTIQVVTKDGSTTTATEEAAVPATKEEQIKGIQSKINEIKRDLNPKERRKQNTQEALDIAKGRGRAVKEFFTGTEATKAKQKQLDDLTKQLEALQSS